MRTYSLPLNHNSDINNKIDEDTLQNKSLILLKSFNQVQTHSCLKALSDKQNTTQNPTPKQLTTCKLFGSQIKTNTLNS